jgi:hypothetical protein
MPTIPENLMTNVAIIESKENFGVWGRFAIAFLTNTEYVSVIDDDTIPMSKWFENCLNTIKEYPGLLGTNGNIFNKGDTYKIEKQIGWHSANEKTTEVDFVGHSWFFKKEWISTLIKDLPSIDKQFLTCGEDMHLSYALQKYLNIPTIVPPHPQNDTSLWGSQKEKAIAYGNVDSTFVNTGIEKFTDALTHYINLGFETILNKSEKIKNNANATDYFINKIAKRENFAFLRLTEYEYIQLSTTDTIFNNTHQLLEDLNNSLLLINTNVYYGIPENESIRNFYYSKITNQHNITFENIFTNHIFIDFINNSGKKCVYIGPNKINIEMIDMVITEPIIIAMNHWNTNYVKYNRLLKEIAEKYTNTLFLIDAGSLSTIFINKLYSENPNNIYIDIEFQDKLEEKIEKNLPVIL